MTLRAIMTGSALKGRLNQLDHRELRSSAYWLTNALMIVATVLGVFLAARVGLQQAIVFDEINGLKQSYNLQSTLADELAENLEVLRHYNSNYLSRALPQQELLLNNPGISHFVWDTMKASPQTLETPGYFLNEVQRFYRTTERIIQGREQQRYGASQAGKLLTEQLDHMEQQVLPRLRGNIQNIGRTLAGYDVVVAEEAPRAP